MFCFSLSTLSFGRSGVPKKHLFGKRCKSILGYRSPLQLRSSLDPDKTRRHRNFPLRVFNRCLWPPLSEAGEGHGRIQLSSTSRCTSASYLPFMTARVYASWGDYPAPKRGPSPQSRRRCSEDPRWVVGHRLPPTSGCCPCCKGRNTG